MNGKIVAGWILLFVGLPSLGEAAGQPTSNQGLQGLQGYLDLAKGKRPNTGTQKFAGIALTRADAAKACELLWADHLKFIRKERSPEMNAKVIRHGEFAMRFEFFVYGKLPKKGRSLFISMHGGGNAPARVNDSQWNNQKRLYRPKEGVYVAPRAPTNTWDLWHQGHIDPLFSRLIENMVATQNVNPNRVYLMGYSAGGDGVYQVAPRMAGCFAAAAMMAGHPNETSPLGLRNLPFAIHVGERDSGFNRNKVALQWKDKLATLNETDPQGYAHYVRIHAGRGHWMNREDAVAVEWMAKHVRNPFPRKIIWKQDNVAHNSFYWLSLPEGQAKAREEIRARIKGQVIDLWGPVGKKVEVNLNDDLVDLQKPVVISSQGKELFKGEIARTIGQLADSLVRRRDREYMFPSQITVTLP
ncbi:MAG: dienelactone hydrolase family protein [Verrucomicrobiota bacterium]|nr:dienelactone hydrolase family protein [Verrucomicrobiota bacterium]